MKSIYHEHSENGIKRVVTPRAASKGKRLDHIPFREGEFLYLDTVCAIFGIGRKRLWNVLSEHRDSLAKAVYRPGRGNRSMRMLSAEDVAFLRTIFRMRVKH